jgi:uncharacterized protein YjbJ (UPF0337 family)
MEEIMDWNRVQGSWKQLEGKVKAKWGLLTDDDLTTIKGSRELLKIQERYRRLARSIRITRASR